MNHIVIDFEFTPVTSNFVDRKVLKYEIIEIGAVKLNDNYELIDSFSSYVHPIYSKLDEYCTFLTGITNRHLAGAPKFAGAISALYEWIGNDDFSIYEWSNSDKHQFSGECRLKNCEKSFDALCMKEWIDLQKEFSLKSKIRSAVNLQDALSKLNLFFEGQAHRACDDALNTARILQIMKNGNEFEERISSYGSPVITVKPCSSTLGDLFSDKLDLLYDLAV